MEQPFVVIRNTYVVDIWSTIHSQILSLETVPFIFQERASSTMPSINNFTRVTFSFCCIYFLSFFLVFSVFAGNLVHFFSCQCIPSIYLWNLHSLCWISSTGFPLATILTMAGVDGTLKLSLNCKHGELYEYDFTPNKSDAERRK